MAVMAKTFQARETFEERNNLFKDLDESVQNCSDIYIDIPDDIMEDHINRHYENMEITSFIVFTFAMLVVAKIIFAIIIAILVQKRYSKVKAQIQLMS